MRQRMLIRLAAVGSAVVGVWWYTTRGPAYGTVEGVVTLNGNPVPGVEVSFWPDPARGGEGARSFGRTDARGHYRLSDAAGREGARVGPHRVCLSGLPDWSDAVPRAASFEDPSVPLPGEPGVASPGVPPLPNAGPADPFASPQTTPFRDVEVRPGYHTIDLPVERSRDTRP